MQKPSATTTTTPIERAIQHGDWSSLLQLALDWQKSKPYNAWALYYAGVAYFHLGHSSLALAYLSASLRQQGNLAQALYFRAQAYWSTGETALAEADLLRCTALQPKHILALRCHIGILGQQQRWAEVVQVLRQLQKADPALPNLDLSFAQAYLHQRQLVPARQHFEAAVAADPGNPNTEWEFAMLLLMEEDFTRGWQYYASRWKTIGWQTLHACPLLEPLWQGESLAGKTVLLHGEQGVGDEIMFASIIPDLLARCKKLMVACHPGLVQIYRHSFPKVQVLAHDRVHPESWQTELPQWYVQLRQQERIDYQIVAGNLGQFFRNQASDFPQQAYLQVEPERVQTMRRALETEKQLQNKHRLRLRRPEGPSAAPAPDSPSAQARPLHIGLAWAGNLRNPSAALRSMPLAALLPLREAFPEAVFVSLQSREYAHLHKEVPQMSLIDMSAHTDDFADLAALMQGLDLVITVDTAFAHIAGATGCPTWLMQSYRGDWRWGWQRQQALWYPSVRIFWQTVAQQWSTVVDDLIAALRQRGVGNGASNSK